MQDMMRGVVTGGTAASIMGNKELSKRMICGKTGTVNDFTDAWFIGYTPTYTAGVWIGYPGLKKTLGNKEAGSVAALPMWIHFMEKFLAGKPSDQFPKAPPPDKDIVAKRGEAERAIRKAQADEDQSKSKATDETADQAKTASQDEDHAKEPGARPVPKMVEPEPGAPRTETPRPPRSDRPRTEERYTPLRPPTVVRPGSREKPPSKEERKRGKNG
jgi:penicillin-binding protein 1A